MENRVIVYNIFVSIENFSVVGNFNVHNWVTARKLFVLNTNSISMWSSIRILKEKTWGAPC